MYTPRDMQMLRKNPEKALSSHLWLTPMLYASEMKVKAWLSVQHVLIPPLHWPYTQSPSAKNGSFLVPSI